MKSAGLLLLKLALTVLCLWWAFSRVDLKDTILARPHAVDYGWLAGGAALAGASMVFTAIRWWFLLRVQGMDVSIPRTVELTMIGNLFNLVSVGNIGGDAARVILLTRDHPGKKLVTTMTVLLDHMVGMVTIAVLFFIISASSFEALADQSVLGRGVIRFAWFYIGGGLALVVLFFICAMPAVDRRIQAKMSLKRWPFMQQIPRIYDAYRSRWKLTLAALGFSFLMVLTYFASFWCGMKAVGGTASAASVMTAMPVIDSVSSLPVSVGGVGVREKLFQVLMDDLAGVPAEISVAASLAGFGCNVLWALLGAAFFLRKRDRIRLKDLDEADAVPGAKGL